MDELISGSWKQIADLGENSLTTRSGALQRHRLFIQGCRDERCWLEFSRVPNGRDVTAAPTLTAKAVSTTQINLDWDTV